MALTVHMSLELMLDFIIEELLQTHKYPMYVIYKRRFPNGTHDLGLVCSMLSNYIKFPVYLAYAVLQMDGWCVNSRYDADFEDTVNIDNLRAVSEAIARFANTIYLLLKVIKLDNELKEAKCKGQIAFYYKKVLCSANTARNLQRFQTIVDKYIQTVEEVFSLPRMDREFILCFMSCLDFTRAKQVIAKRISLGQQTHNQQGYTGQQEIVWGREACALLHVDSSEQFVKSMGNLLNRYPVDIEYLDCVFGNR